MSRKNFHPLAAGSHAESDAFFRRLYKTTQWIDTSHPQYHLFLGQLCDYSFGPASRYSIMLPQVIEHGPPKTVLDGTLLDILLARLEVDPVENGALVELLLQRYCGNPSFAETLVRENFFRRKPMDRLLPLPKLLLLFLKALSKSDIWNQHCASCSVEVWKSVLPVVSSKEIAEDYLVDQLLTAAWLSAFVSGSSDYERNLRFYLSICPKIPSFAVQILLTGRLGSVRIDSTMPVSRDIIEATIIKVLQEYPANQN
jgi:hypothetical protein